MALQQREKTLIAVLVAAAIGAGIWQGVIPAYNKYQEMQKEIEANVKKIKESFLKARNVDKLRKEVKEVKKKLAAAERRLPAQENLTLLLKDIEKIALESKVEPIRIIQFGQQKQAKLYTELPIKFSAGPATMESIVKMIYAIDIYQRLIDISSISILPVESKDSNLWSYNIDMTMNVFVFKKETKKASRKSKKGK